jgi:hypothetical protein
MRRWLWHDGVAYGLAFDPRAPVTTRVPRTPIEVRPIQGDETAVFTTLPPGGGERVEALTRINARLLLESGLKTCYVGVTEEGPVYMQFLITADQNERLKELYGTLFAPLEDDEGLLEFAFTLQQHRARPVMPSVLLRLLEIGREQGLRRIVTYVHVGNPGFIRFLLRIGFVPFTLRLEKSRLLRRRTEFRPLTPDTVDGFEAPEDIDALTESLLRLAAG